MDKISIVIPCFNEEEAIPVYYMEMKKIMKEMSYVGFELFFVDDGSSDRTLQELRALSDKDERCNYLSFSRNFGKEAAIYAGLSHITGNYGVVMDVDLQDPPELLVQMFQDLESGEYDCVATRRVSRKGEPPIRSLFAKLFYSMINKISKTEIVDGARDYRLMTRQMVDAILEVKEYNRFSKGIFSWVGFNTKWLEYENVERRAGETKWSFWKLLKYSLDGIVAFSTVPLSIASILGLLLCFIAFVLIIVIVVKTLAFGDPVAGYPSLMCVILFVGGVQLFCMGILGKYLSKTYLETKKRPIYLVKEENIDEK